MYNVSPDGRYLRITKLDTVNAANVFISSSAGWPLIRLQQCDPPEPEQMFAPMAGGAPRGEEVIATGALYKVYIVLDRSSGYEIVHEGHYFAQSEENARMQAIVAAKLITVEGLLFVTVRLGDVKAVR